MIVSVHPDQLDAFVEMIAETEVDFTNLGEVRGNEVVIDEKSYGTVDSYRVKYDSAIGELMQN